MNQVVNCFSLNFILFLQYLSPKPNKYSIPIEALLFYSYQGRSCYTATPSVLIGEANSHNKPPYFPILLSTDPPRIHVEASSVFMRLILTLSLIILIVVLPFVPSWFFLLLSFLPFSAVSAATSAISAATAAATAWIVPWLAMFCWSIGRVYIPSRWRWASPTSCSWVTRA